MLHAASSPPSPISDSRDERRRQLLQALHAQADRLLERMADALVDLPEDQSFGPIEYTLRDLGQQLVAAAHQAGLEVGKKRATSAPAASARTAGTTPASSPTAPRPG